MSDDNGSAYRPRDARGPLRSVPRRLSLSNPAAEVALSFRRHMEPNGDVRFPAGVAAEMARFMVVALQQEGGKASYLAQELLTALHVSALEEPERAARAVLSISASGSGDAESAILVVPGITSAQAAEILECSTRTVTNLCRSRKVLATRAGRDWLINAADLHRYRFDKANGATPN